MGSKEATHDLHGAVIFNPVASSLLYDAGGFGIYLLEALKGKASLNLSAFSALVILTINISA